MRLRHLLETSVAAGLLGLVVSPAVAQIRVIAPIAPMPMAPVIAPMPLRPLPLPVAPLPLVNPLPPVYSAPPPVVPTRPEPPLVRENPPILPAHHDDRPKEDDPFWMSRALDKVERERQARNVAYEVQAPPPPPPPAMPSVPAVPVSGESSDRSKPEHWLMLVAILVGIAAFAVGRATRSR